MTIGRNDPCPCGSGRKYKKCCGAAASERAAPTSTSLRYRAIGERDREIASQLVRYTRSKCGRDWVRHIVDVYTGGEAPNLGDEELSFAVAWALFHHVDENLQETVAQRFRSERGSRLLPEERALLAAQCDAWLSIWEVQRVEAGVGVEMVDLLRHEIRFVHDVSVSRSLVARDVILARVVTVEDVSYFGVVHPRALKPRDAEIIARDIRKLARVRTRPVSIAHLRDGDFLLELIDHWRARVEFADQPPPMPVLTNTDGEALSPTVDHFRYDQGAEPEIKERLSKLPDVDVREEAGGETVFVLLRQRPASQAALGSTVIGQVWMRDGILRIDSLSVKRADDNRKLVEQLLGSLVAWRIREEVNVDAEMQHRRTASRVSAARRSDLGATPFDPPPELREKLRDMRQGMMDGWPDEQVPALGMRTPRQAWTTPSGRREVELLLREFENNEARKPAEDRIDIGRIRARLGK